MKLLIAFTTETKVGIYFQMDYNVQHLFEKKEEEEKRKIKRMNPTMRENGLYDFFVFISKRKSSCELS